jgi:hypothetical protein
VQVRMMMQRLSPKPALGLDPRVCSTAIAPVSAPR